MNTRILILCIFTCILSACSSSTPPPTSATLSASEHSLAEASYSVSQAMSDIAETESAARPKSNIAPPPSAASYGMGGVTSIDWVGPVGPVVKKIADAANYRFTVLGRAPAIPVMVTVYQKNAMLGDILRDIGYQCGERASVVVFPGSRTIELRYAKS